MPRSKIFLHPVKNGPCYGCSRRHTLCHTKCEDYKEYRAEVDEYDRQQEELYRTNLTHVSRKRIERFETIRGNRKDD